MFFWHIWFFVDVFGVFLAYLVFFGIVGIFAVVGVFWCTWCFWRSWCFALRACFLFGILGVWFGVFGILSSLKMCRFLLINFAESSRYHVFLWKEVHWLEKKAPPPVEAVETNMRYVFYHLKRKNVHFRLFLGSNLGHI